MHSVSTAEDSGFRRVAAGVFVAFGEDEPHFLDALVGEGQNTVIIVEVVNPDDAILGFQAESEVVDEVFIDAELFGDVCDGVDVVNLVSLRAHAAAASSADAGGFQFQGSNPSS